LRKKAKVENTLKALAALTNEELIDFALVAKAMGHAGSDLDLPISARGHRLLSKVPRLPSNVADRIVTHFGSLLSVMTAGIDELQAVEGVGENRARSVREGLSRLAETAILERYV